MISCEVVDINFCVSCDELPTIQLQTILVKLGSCKAHMYLITCQLIWLFGYGIAQLVSPFRIL